MKLTLKLIELFLDGMQHDCEDQGLASNLRVLEDIGDHGRRAGRIERNLRANLVSRIDKGKHQMKTKEETDAEKFWKQPPTNTSIRLKRGDKPLELSGRDLLIGLTKECDPGHTVEIGFDPQLMGVGLSLLVDRTTGENFDLEDIRIGKNSQFVCNAPIPLSMFVVHVDGYPNMGEIKLWEEKYREFLDLEKCAPGMRMSVTVTNKSREPLTFKGAFLYRCADWL